MQPSDAQGERSLLNLRAVTGVVYALMLAGALYYWNRLGDPILLFAAAYLVVAVVETTLNIFVPSPWWGGLTSLQVGIPLCGLCLLLKCSVAASVSAGLATALLTFAGYAYAMRRNRVRPR